MCMVDKVLNLSYRLYINKIGCKPRLTWVCNLRVGQVYVHKWHWLCNNKRYCNCLAFRPVFCYRYLQLVYTCVRLSPCLLFLNLFDTSKWWLKLWPQFRLSHLIFKFSTTWTVNVVQTHLQHLTYIQSTLGNHTVYILEVFTWYQQTWRTLDIPV